ncbi:hypothetical protein AB6A40_004221 [Gnathostoma spinigerum]|uniref:Uncharacterized protein n=1 Tax=Gnathostoma spinigerum TaxID=75299 RepID=A0ABD6ELS2_9BILA
MGTDDERYSVVISDKLIAITNLVEVMKMWSVLCTVSQRSQLQHIVLHETFRKLDTSSFDVNFASEYFIFVDLRPLNVVFADKSVRENTSMFVFVKQQWSPSLEYFDFVWIYM